MFRPLELYAGLKYTRAKRRNHFISFISSISMGGIALAVMLLITVLSVMNGFEAELRDRILGMASHVEISGSRGGLQERTWPPPDRSSSTTSRARCSCRGAPSCLFDSWDI